MESKDITTQLPFSSNALQVLKKRYLLHSIEGKILETPEEMFVRVAKTIASVESNYGHDQTFIDALTRDYYDIMTRFEFLPAGRTLANAGGPTRLVSNCIVLHIEDSMESIFQTLKDAALLQKAGSGLGFPLHLMRPAGFVTKASLGTSSGPVSFLQIYNTSFGVIKQQNRHGANMAVMRVDHPDILEFIHCKDKEGNLRNFNVSVGITNEFMERVRSGCEKEWICKFGDKEYKPRQIQRDDNWNILSIKDVSMTPSQLFQEIINCAWKTGEPGIVFLDTVNQTNPLPGLGRIESCNPCFHPDTMISTESGPRKICEITCPTWVHTVDLSGRLCLGMAGASFKTKSDAELVKVKFSGGRSLVVTPDHKVFVLPTMDFLAEGRWTECRELKRKDIVIGIKCLLLGERMKTFERVDSVEYLEERSDVWDISVPSTHCLFAGGILAHNCGEQFLHDGDVCNLGAINLEKFVDGGQINYPRLGQVVRLAIRMLDCIIDLSDFPCDKVNKVFRDNRRIGLGIMGFADMLYQLFIGYDSQEGRDVAANVMSFINSTAHEMSQQLADEKGVFPNWDLSIYKRNGVRQRNAALTNIAPTGTISMLYDCSGGVEPYFALAYYYSKILGGDVQLSYFNKHLCSALKAEGVYNPELIDQIIREGSVARIPAVPERIRKTFVTAMDISAKDHILMQATFQKYCDNAISKTINFPNSATKADILEGYLKAWENGCKGCTVYRDGSRMEQVLNLHKDENKNKCPECGTEYVSFAFGESCHCCKNCGYSKCNS